jgi:hypothetical protein
MIIRKLRRQIVSLRPEDIGVKYHLHAPVISLNEAFLKGFSKDNKDLAQLMEDWWLDEDSPFKQGKRLIPTQEFKTPYMMLIFMISRIYGEEKSLSFPYGVASHGLHNCEDKTGIQLGRYFNFQYLS